MSSDTAIIIPARLESNRLENKPLQKIGDLTMIEHVYRNVSKLKSVDVYVATDSEEVADLITKTGGNAIMTKEASSGTDRVHMALKQIKNNKIEYVINVQGDMPFIEAETVKKVISTLRKSDCGIVTPVVEVGVGIAKKNSNVKVVIDKNNHALYFSRSIIPSGAESFYYHVGIYGFKVDALKKMVKLPRSSLEKAESLEQLRALENGIKIETCLVNNIPISVDTVEDLEHAMSYWHDNL